MSLRSTLPLHGRANGILGTDPIPPGRWHYVGESGEPAFENGWVNAGGDKQPLRFRLTNEKDTQIDGSVTGGTDGTAVTTLLAMYRQDKDIDAPGVGGTWTFKTTGELIFTATTPVVDPTALHWGDNTDPGSGLSLFDVFDLLVKLLSGAKFRVFNSSNAVIFEVDENGALFKSRLGAGGTWEVDDSGGSAILQIVEGGVIAAFLPSGATFTLYDSSSNPMLQMTEGDPNLYIKTGGSVIASL